MNKKIKKFIQFHLPRELKTYLFFIFATITTILAINIFLYLTDKSHKIFLEFFQNNQNIFFILTPINYIIILYLVKNYSPFVASSGIPQTIASVKPHNKKIRDKLLGFKVAGLKIIFISIATLFGAPLGVGGPSIHIGSAIFYGFANSITIKRQVLIHNFIATGAGLALMVAFNSPLAGISFIFEEIYRNAKKRLVLFSVLIMLIIFIISKTYNNPYLIQIATNFNLALLWLILISILICSIIGAIFVKFSLLLINKITKFNTKIFLLIALILGLLVAIFNYLSSGLTSGGGKDEVIKILSGESFGLEFLILKISIVFSSLVSTIPGGIFIPSITIGASFGDVITTIFHTHSNLIILITMISYLSAVSRTPITATLIILEITNSLNLIIIGLVVAFISNYISKLIQQEPLYYGLAQNFSKN